MKTRVLDINLFNGKPVEASQLNSLITTNINNAIKNMSNNSVSITAKPSKPSTVTNTTQNKTIASSTKTNQK